MAKVISELLNELGQVKTTANNHYKEYKALKEQEDGLKFKISETLKEMGLKTAKGDKYQVSLSEKHDIKVTSESNVLFWLKESPDVEADAYIGLKTTAFKNLANQMLKDTGEMVPGTELTMNEIVSVRANRKGK